MMLYIYETSLTHVTTSQMFSLIGAPLSEIHFVFDATAFAMDVRFLINAYYYYIILETTCV